MNVPTRCETGHFPSRGSNVIHDPLTPRRRGHPRRRFDRPLAGLGEQGRSASSWSSTAGGARSDRDGAGRTRLFLAARRRRRQSASATPIRSTAVRPGPTPARAGSPTGSIRPSAVYFPERFAWDEGGWTGIAREDLVFYELHVGTFTPEGTFDAIVPRIDALRDLGITAIELMPVGQFPGRRSWGYDGVHPFAVQNSYGGPEALQRLVEACHRKGMAVFLDVIYNHFGPEATSSPTFGDYLTEQYKTDWGPAINYDGRGCDPVRVVGAPERPACGSATTTSTASGSTRPTRSTTAARATSSPRSPRPPTTRPPGSAGPVHVFAETDLNDAPRFLHPLDRGGYGFDGHWNDDFHHAAPRRPDRRDERLLRRLRRRARGAGEGRSSEVFVNDGNYSPFRGRRHGTPATEFPGDRFVAFTQNHDQVGNRLKSDRYAASLPAVGRPAGRGRALAARPGCRCCSWARSTARPTPSPSSATSRRPS